MNNAEQLSQAFLQSQPQAGAALLQEFTPQEAAHFLAQLPLSIVTTTLATMASWPAARIISELPISLSSQVLGELNTARSETLLRLIKDEQRAEILKQLPRSTAKSFNLKLAYPLGTVGAWMDTSTPYFTPESSVADCLDFIKRRQSHVDGVVTVVDEFRHFVGLVNLDSLLISDAKQSLANLINTEVTPLPAKAILWEIKQHPAWSHFPTLPVIDHQQHILGTLSHSALIEGTKKTIQQHGKTQRFSIMSHMGRAFLVALSGLIQVAWGGAEQPYSKENPQEKVNHE